jgi:3-hydroxybutyryl-CoA dehydratase
LYRHDVAGSGFALHLHRGAAKTGSNVTLLPFQTLYFEDLSLGMTETYTKTVKSSDVIGFAELSGDRNPIHLSEHFAARTPFRGRIAHGLYTASLVSAVIGTRLPGPGAIYLSQTLNFKAPVKIGDTVIAKVEVVELIERGSRAKLSCQCRVGETVVLEGEALVKIPTRAEAERR